MHRGIRFQEQTNYRMVHKLKLIIIGSVVIFILFSIQGSFLSNIITLYLLIGFGGIDILTVIIISDSIPIAD